MPLTVPRREQAQVATAPIPGVRVPTDVPPAALGAPGGLDLGGAQKQATDFVQREREKADTVAVLDADNKLATLATDLSTKAVQLKGKDALDATRQVRDAWDQSASSILGLSSEQQQVAVRHRIAAHWNALYEQTEEHTAREYAQYTQKTFDDAVSVSVNEVGDPSRDSAKALADLNNKVSLQAHVMGWSPETEKLERLKATTQAHTARIQNLLATDQDQAAAKYFADHQGEIASSVQDNLQKSLEIESTRAESQRTADGIVARATDLQAALTESQKITDPKLRDETEQRVRRHFEDMAFARRQQKEQAFRQATDIVLKTGDFNKIPVALRAELDGSEEWQLRQRADSVRHPKRESDQSIVYGLKLRAGAHPDEFAKTDLLQLYQDGKLSDKDFSVLSNLQRSALLFGERGGERDAKAIDKGLHKRLSTAQATADFYTQNKLAIPPALAARVKALKDSLKAPAAAVPVVPKAPGAPIVPLFQSPSTSNKPTSSINAPVPANWLAHADQDPAYAAYLSLHDEDVA